MKKNSKINYPDGYGNNTNKGLNKNEYQKISEQLLKTRITETIKKISKKKKYQINALFFNTLRQIKVYTNESFFIKYPMI